jgi:AraC family transcriptional regulator
MEPVKTCRLVSDSPRGKPRPFCPDLRVLHSSRGAPWDEAIALELVHLPGGTESGRCFSMVQAVVIHLRQEEDDYFATERLINGRFRKLKLWPEDLQISPLGKELGERWKPWRECLGMAPQAAFVERTAWDTFNTDRVDLVPSDGVRDPQILHIALALWSEVQCGYPSGRMYGESLALALVIRLLCSYSTSPRKAPALKGGMPRRLLRQTTEYINQNLTASLRLNDLAANVNMSPYHFCRQFRQSMGMPPHQYVLHQRVARAKRMLTEGTRSIAEISAELGFSDQSHFSNIFRQMTGTSPRHFRPN